MVDPLVQFAGIVALCVRLYQIVSDCVRSASSNDGSRVIMTLKLVIHLYPRLFGALQHAHIWSCALDGTTVGGGKGSGEGTPHTPPRGKPLSVYRKPLCKVR